jgi:hypothetical protein
VQPRAETDGAFRLGGLWHLELTRVLTFSAFHLCPSMI